MMQTESAVLLQQSASLAEGFAQFAARLTLAAQALQDPGVPPPENLIDELTSSQRNFRDLRTCALTLAQSLPISPLPEAEAIVSLVDLKALLWTVKQGEEQKAHFEARRQQALQVLDRVLAVVHRDQIVFPPLLECKERANELRLAVSAVRWPDSHPLIDVLVEGKHPFLDLLTLVEGQEELDDDRWAALQDTIEQECGRPLAVAASRGKLTMSLASLPEQPSATSITSDVAMTHSDQPAVLLEQPSESPDSPAVTDQDTDLHVDTALLIAPQDGATAEEWGVEETVAVLAEVESAEETANELPHGAEPETETASPVVMAASLLETHEEPESQTQPEAHLEEPSDERLSLLRNLMWQLVAEDKSNLALHIAGYLETRHPELQPHMPAWLLRSVALGRLIRHANGEIARLLKEDFTRFTPECFATHHNGWNQAIQLLLVAATLQPALLAPQTGASTVLHALQLPEEVSQLSQICRLIADYGDSGEPLDPKVLRKGKEQAVWQTTMDELKKSVEAWSTRTLTVSMPHPPATKVWKKWQEPKGVLNVILSTIRQNDLSKLTQVKRTIEQLADDAQIKREVERTDREVLGRRLGDDITGRALELIRRHTREAIVFARRWVELQETRAGQNKGSSNEQAERLRQEVWSRQSSVFEELNNCKRRHPSLLMVGSIASCQRAFDNVKTLFDPQASFPAEEPLPRPFLYADLLRIPAVTLNDQWELENTDLETLIDGILELVANQLPKNGGR
jgi:hypothetical protein